MLGPRGILDTNMFVWVTQKMLMLGVAPNGKPQRKMGLLSRGIWGLEPGLISKGGHSLREHLM